MNGSTITVRWGGGEQHFDTGDDVAIGREPGCDVVIDNANVSRRHALITRRDGGWKLVDTDSSQGVHVDGAAVTEVALAGSTEVVLGRPGRGEPVTITVGVTEPVGDASTSDLTVTVDERPGGGLRADALSQGTVVTGETIRVECAGRSYEFNTGSSPTIGRDPAADIVSANPTVSRRHARLSHTNGWLLEDLGSSGGIFVDGRRVPSVKLSGTVTAFLGDVDAGERVVFVTSGKSPRRRAAGGMRGRVLVGIIAVLALVVAGVALVQAIGDDDDAPTDDRLARATVQLFHDNTDGDGIITGSGTVIDAEQGLILTNAHVVAPSAPGTGVRDGIAEPRLAPNPDEIEIWVSSGLDNDAQPTYRGRVVAADGYLDLAVVQITEFISGALIEDGDLDDLVELEIGDSDEVSSGDAIRVVGYPGVARSGSPLVTSGDIGNAIRDDRLRMNRALFNTTAEISPGNSGGAAVDGDGRLVGVPTSVLVEGETGGRLGHIRPIALAGALIEAARSEEPYRSSFFTPVTGDEEITDVRSVRPADTPGFASGRGRELADLDPGRTSVAFEIGYEKFRRADHQDILVTLFDETRSQVVSGAETHTQYPFAVDKDGTFVVTLALDDLAGLRPGDYRVTVFVGPNYTVVGRVSFAV